MSDEKPPAVGSERPLTPAGEGEDTRVIVLARATHEAWSQGSYAFDDLRDDTKAGLLAWAQRTLDLLSPAQRAGEGEAWWELAKAWFLKMERADDEADAERAVRSFAATFDYPAEPPITGSGERDINRAFLLEMQGNGPKEWSARHMFEAGYRSAQRAGEPTPERIERVAKAICEAVGVVDHHVRGGLLWDRLTDEDQELYRMQARAAIAAQRAGGPTPEMVEALEFYAERANYFMHEDPGDDKRAAVAKDRGERARAALDAARPEAKPEATRDDWTLTLLEAERNLRLLGIEMVFSREMESWKVSIYNKGAAVVKHSREERRRLRWAGTERLQIDVPRDESVVDFQKRRDREDRQGPDAGEGQ